MLVELLEGPFDGELLARSSPPPPFVWIDRASLLRTSPGEGRTLYRLIGRRRGVIDQVAVYRHAQLEIARCEGCGFFAPRSHVDCVLCGRSLSPV